MGSVESVSGSEASQAAGHVGSALRAWHEGGASGGDIAFWRRHVEHFDSPHTYARVIEALLERQDYLAAMALLMQWVGQADEISLQEGEDSFHTLAMRWMSGVTASRRDAPPKTKDSSSDDAVLGLKMLDYLEANAETYWEVPTLELDDETANDRSSQERDDAWETQDEEDDDEKELYGAAYEGVP